MTTKLNDILGFLEPLAIKGSVTNLVFEDFTDDSRKVKLNTLFFAIKGANNDGHNFLPDIENIITAAVVERLVDGVNCVQILVRSSKEALLKLLEMKYGVSISDFSFIGITGTNGKTTFTYLMESILESCGKKPAVIGTVNYRCGGYIHNAPNTTPDVKSLIPILKDFYKSGCREIIMEVSSHALTQGRIDGVTFDAASFSNLTPEHLDYHRDMEDYYNAKKVLFTRYLKQNGVAVINVDDNYGRRLFSELTLKGKKGISFSGSGDFNCEMNVLANGFMQVEITGMGLKDVIKTKLKGRFNAFNVANAYITSLLLGYESGKIKEGIERIENIPGRLEEIENELGISVFVDYAHTPDALLNILITVKEFTKGRLILVFGCGGDRDRTKRPKMGKIATENADIVIITSDNPRSEEPLSIIEEIKEGIPVAEKVITQPDREKAIEEAIFIAKKGDSVVIAGKGHEDYQIIGDKKFHFSDREVAKKILEKRQCMEGL